MTYRGRIQNGVVVLDEPASLAEGTEVTVIPVTTAGDRVLELALQVYEGLPPEIVEEVEHIALDRRDFFGEH
jgi:hypothetical protein